MKNEKQIEEMLKAGTSVTATAKHFYVSKITVASLRDNAGIRNMKPSYSFSSDVLDSAVSDINEDKKKKDGEYITMGTWTCNAFGKFRKTFYPRGKGLKAMPVSLVDEMTPLSLAVWYMGDGSLNRNTGVFTLGKQITNAQEIVDKLNLLFGCSFVLKDYGRYYQIRTMNCSKFFSFISPYILTSFGYKIPKSYQNLVGNQQPSLERNLLEGSETRQKAKDQKSMPINAACVLNTAETAGTWDTLSK